MREPVEMEDGPIPYDCHHAYNGDEMHASLEDYWDHMSTCYPPDYDADRYQ